MIICSPVRDSATMIVIDVCQHSLSFVAVFTCYGFQNCTRSITLDEYLDWPTYMAAPMPFRHPSTSDDQHDHICNMQLYSLIGYRAIEENVRLAGGWVHGPGT